MSFLQRNINVIFKAGNGPVGNDGSQPPVSISGLRMSASIEVTGSPSMNKAALTIYGMTQQMMNQFSRAGVIPIAQRNNSITVNAGDASGMSLVYAGILQQAYQDYQAAPEVAFNVFALTNLFNAMQPIAPTSYTGPTDVATAMGKLAAQMGYDFEPNGVNVKVQSPYLFGTARQQMLQLAYAANIFAFIENDKTLVLLDKFTARAGNAVPIKVGTGMVGYPKVTQQGWFSVRTIFDPSIVFLGRVIVTSSNPTLCGTFRVRALRHSLESQMPNGAWFTDIDYSVFGLV